MHPPDGPRRPFGRRLPKIDVCSWLQIFRCRAFHQFAMLPGKANSHNSVNWPLAVAMLSRSKPSVALFSLFLQDYKRHRLLKDCLARSFTNRNNESEPR